MKLALLFVGAALVLSAQPQPTASLLVAAQSSSVSGALGGTVDSTTTAVNLTTSGTTDWIAWGGGSCPGINRKSTGGSLISAYTLGSGQSAVLDNTSAPYSISWTGGTPTSSATAETNGCHSTPGNVSKGFSFTAPCGTATHTLIVYAYTLSGSTYQMAASLSDSSATPYNDGPTGPTTVHRTYTFVYNCSSNSQTINISWITTAGGNPGLAGAAYQ